MPKYLVLHAALDRLNRWVIGPEDAPPTSPQIAEAADGSLARDPVTGNTVGGIRTPAVDAPTAAYFGDKDQCAPTLGKTVPYDAATLAAVHGTHKAYVDKVKRSAKAAVAAGFLLPFDAKEIIATARRSTLLQ